MLISQTAGYFENPQYDLLEEPMLFLFALKWKLLREAAKPLFQKIPVLN